MKKIAIILLSIFVLCSCSWDKKQQEKEQLDNYDAPPVENIPNNTIEGI